MKRPLCVGGFTLLEILVTLILFTACIIAITGLFTRGLVASRDAENTAIAMNLAQRKIEEIKNLEFAAIADEAKADVDIDIDGDTVNDFPGFQIEVEVDDPPGDPAEADLKQVTVTVYWTHRGGEVEVPLVTYISQT